MRWQKVSTRPLHQDGTLLVTTLGIVVQLMTFDNIAEIVCDPHQINTNEWIIATLSEPQKAYRDSFQGLAIDRPRSQVIALDYFGTSPGKET
jgi:hypothetical protein